MISDYSIVTVHCVAAAAEIIVPALGSEQIIRPVVDTLIGDNRAVLVALCGVIENYIKNNLYAVFVKHFDKVFELICFHTYRCRCGIACLRSKEAYS